MRIPLNKFLEKLGVGHVLSPYETQPWLVYDEAKGITCSAEVRMGPGGQDVEAEIQFLHDEKEGDESNGGGGEQPRLNAGGREQILWMRAEPFSPVEWGPKILRIKGKDYVNAFSEWEDKGCDFFLACVGALQMGEIPDIEALIEDKMKDTDQWGGGRRGRVGKKAPTIKPAQLMGGGKP